MKLFDSQNYSNASSSDSKTLNETTEIKTSHLRIQFPQDEMQVQDENLFDTIIRTRDNTDTHIFREGFNVHVQKYNPSSNINFKREIEYGNSSVSLEPKLDTTFSVKINEFNSINSGVNYKHHATDGMQYKKSGNEKIIHDMHNDSVNSLAKRTESDSVSINKHVVPQGVLISRRSQRKCHIDTRKTIKICRKSCRIAYLNVCLRVRCSSEIKRELRYRFRKSCRRIFDPKKSEEWGQQSSSLETDDSVVSAHSSDIDRLYDEDISFGNETDPLENNSESIRWNTDCFKKAARNCKRACVRGFKVVCNKYLCSARANTTLKQECRRSCEGQFMLEDMACNPYFRKPQLPSHPLYPPPPQYPPPPHYPPPPQYHSPPLWG